MRTATLCRYELGIEADYVEWHEVVSSPRHEREVFVNDGGNDVSVLTEDSPELTVNAARASKPGMVSTEL